MYSNICISKKLRPWYYLPLQPYNVPTILFMTSQTDSHANCLPQSLIQYHSEDTKCAYNCH